MKQVYDKQILSDVQAGRFEPAYLLSGEDGYLLGRVISRLVDGALAGASRDFNLDTFHGMDCSPSDVVSAAISLPMMADRRVVVVKGIDRMRKPEQVAEYLGSPSPDTVLIMVAEGVDRPKAMSLARKFEDGVFAYLYPPRDSETPRWISSIAGDYGYSLSRDAAEHLRDMLGNNLALIDSEIRKVINHVGDRKTIDVDDVTASVGDFGLPLIFGISDALAERNVSEAFFILSKLIGQGTHPLQLNALLAGHWRKLLTARDMLDRGLGQPEVEKKLRLNKFNRAGIMRQARSMKPEELARGVRLLSEADVDLKSSAVPGRLIMERLFLELAGAA